MSANQVSNSGTYGTASRAWNGNTDTYYQQRTVVVNQYRNSYPNVYVVSHNLHPNYGIYDSGFLTGMFMGYLGSSMIHNATWLASQQNQPWYNSYRADLDRQAATNAELRAKIAEMDAEIARQKAAGNVAASNSVPQGVNPALAIAPEAVMAATPENTSWVWLWIVLAAMAGGFVVYMFVRR